jgi:ABC-type Fe3+/spermidine/putrescine transport system ATPase subunit
MAPMLSLESISVHYGAICALRDVSIEVNSGEIVTLIGSNGAGKSTTLRAVSALRRPSSGKISFEGKDLAGKKPHEVLRMGLAQVPEGRGIFPNLTVRENLRMMTYSGVGLSTVEGEAYARFPRLAERRQHVLPAGLVFGCGVGKATQRGGPPRFGEKRHWSCRNLAGRNGTILWSLNEYSRSPPVKLVPATTYCPSADQSSIDLFSSDCTNTCSSPTPLDGFT